MLGVAYLASIPLGCVDVFRILLRKDVFLADVETGAKDMLGDGETSSAMSRQRSRRRHRRLGQANVYIMSLFSARINR